MRIYIIYICNQAGVFVVVLHVCCLCGVCPCLFLLLFACVCLLYVLHLVVVESVLVAFVRNVCTVLLFCSVDVHAFSSVFCCICV